MATETKQNLPKLELTANQTIKLKLLRDKPYEGKNNYGPFYLYTVSDGADKSWFAPAEIHEQIQKHSLRTGSEFILRTNPGANGRKNALEISFEALQTETLPTNGHTDRFKEIMQQSLQDAISITREAGTIPFQGEDVRALTNALFIARTKTNYN